MPPPCHQLLLLLTKVPAAQSQGEEGVILGLVKDLLPHLLRELIQTPSVLDLPRVAVVLFVASFFGRLLPGTGAARGRRSLSLLRHLPCLRDDVSTDKKFAFARSLVRSIARGCAPRLSCLLSLFPPWRRSPRSPLLKHRSPVAVGVPGVITLAFPLFLRRIQDRCADKGGRGETGSELERIVAPRRS